VKNLAKSAIRAAVKWQKGDRVQEEERFQWQTTWIAAVNDGPMALFVMPYHVAQRNPPMHGRSEALAIQYGQHVAVK
jgi:hypothetical protein